MDESAQGRAPSPRALVVMGVSGSGKTTFAERLAQRLGWRMLEGDGLHPPANVEKMRRGEPLTDADRAPWLDRIGQMLNEIAAEGQSAVVACSALKRVYRERLLGARPGLVFVYLKASRALLEARVRARHHEYMPASLLDSQLATLEEPAPDEPAIVVDAAMAADEGMQAAMAALGFV